MDKELAAAMVESAWQFTTPPPGTYRADVLLGADIAWRGYFKVK